MGEIPINVGYDNTIRSYYEYRSTEERNRIYELLETLNEFATEFCELYDTTCCTR